MRPLPRLLIMACAGACLLAGCRLRPASPPLPSPATPSPVTAAGAQPAPDPQALTFSAQDQRPVATPDLLPANAPAIFGFVQWPRRVTVSQIKVTWGRAGKSTRPVPPADVSLVSGSPSLLRLVLRPEAAKLTPGLYEVDVVGPDHRVTGTFMVAWGAPQILSQTAPPAIEVKVSEAKMATGVKDDGSPRGSVKVLVTGTEAVYFVFRYGHAEPGVGLTITWSLDGEPLKAATREVTLKSSAGWAHAWMQSASPLPAGTLRATVRLSGDEADLATAEVTVPQTAGGPSTE